MAVMDIFTLQNLAHQGHGLLAATIKTTLNDVDTAYVGQWLGDLDVDNRI